jgi:hypothetical protein
MLAHETSPVSGASVVGMTSGVRKGRRCMPAGIPGVSTASSKKDRLQPTGPAVPAAGWRLHRGEPEPGNEDKIPPMARSPKAAWPRQDRQGQRTGVTPATTGLHQPEGRSLPHERIRGKREGICLPDASPRGQKALYEAPLPEEDRGGPGDHAEDAAAGSRQPGSRPPNL